MKKITRIIFWNLLLLLVVIIPTELIFGGWLGNNYGTLVIPRDVTRRFVVSDLYEDEKKIIKFTRDKNGFRGSRNNPSNIDILAVGGSSTNEIFIDDNQTWTAVLEASFQLSGKNISVVNGGVDGQSTVGHLANFEYWYPKIPNFKPRYILFMIGINDIVISKSGYLSKQDKFLSSQGLFKQYMLNNSAIYTLFRNFRGILRARNARLIHTMTGFDGYSWRTTTRQPSVEKAIFNYKTQLSTYRKRLELLTKRTRDLGATPIIVTQHDATYRIKDNKVAGRVLGSGEVDYGNYAILAAPNRVAMKTCADVGAICIDLFADLLFGNGDHYDAFHTTPSGSSKIANFLYQKLRDRITVVSKITD